MQGQVIVPEEDFFMKKAKEKKKAKERNGSGRSLLTPKCDNK